ncbi:MAG TPA: alanine racemase [Candidatus Competibacteraceae bacterium]|nr:alanine racemase [Candidatus Competibacteraceae bacterium]
MRAATATIHLDAIRHNLTRVRQLAPGSRVVAVVKANGYGHGAARILPALSGADALGVACIEEALALREAGACLPVLLLEGVFEAEELPLCARHGFQIAVHEPGQLAMLEQARLERPLVVWLKLDSGMHRLGFPPERVRQAWQRLQAAASVAEVRLMSHFASADDPDDPQTAAQLEVWRAALDGIPGARSLANSAGVLAWPSAHHDWVRPGVMLYGVSPMKDRTGPDDGLRPAMTLATRLIAVQRLQRGEKVGYSGTFVCPEDMDIGIAAIGYGDGYPRHAGSGTPVLVNGRAAALAGRVSMDMLAIDLRRVPGAKVGDPVVLWGAGLPVERIAAAAGTIGYELLCAVKPRVRFVVEE